MGLWTLNIRAHKQVKRALLNLRSERQAFTELWGTKGIDEHRSSYISLFGPICNQPAVDLYEALGKRHEWLVTKNNRQAVLDEIAAAMDEAAKTRPVKDKRTTPDENAKEQAEAAASAKKREDERGTREAKIGLAGEGTIAAGNGTVLLSIRAHFNDSDAMTDYFHMHASISDLYALGTVPAGPRREATARRVLEQVPELAAMTWTWHTENYSGGHGNYLKSAPVGEIAHNAYNGRKRVSFWYELTTGRSNAMPKSRFFVEAPSG